MSAADAIGPILAALDGLAAEGRSVAVWWRDDDAVSATPALDRLLDLRDRTGFPLALAVIPAGIDASLVARISAMPDVEILVHGLGHADHAAPGAKPAEFGPDRPLATMLAEGETGLTLVQGAFAAQAKPVFVPPWNRIAPALAAGLVDRGYEAVSTFGSAASLCPGGLVRLDTHVDPVAWRGSRSLADPAAIAAAFCRACSADSLAIGLLTHHLVFDAPLWDWLGALLPALAAHPAVRPSAASALVGSLRDGNKVGREASSRSRRTAVPEPSR